jgi:hypothetical protein
VPAAAAWKAAQINADAKTKTKPKPQSIPKAKPSTRSSTETTADADAESHIGAKGGEDISTDHDIDQTMGDGPTRKAKKPGSPGPALTTCSSMADRRLIPRKDETVPLPNKLDQEIASAINIALFHRQAPVDIRIMNARRNAKGVTTAITHQNSTAAIAMKYPDIIIMAARTVAR